MIVLGIDPGLADVGYGAVEQIDEPGPRGRRVVHLAHGVIQTKPSEPLAARLDRIHRALREIIRDLRPDAAAIEELFFASNLRTAVAVAQARGVAILATSLSGIPLAEFSPPRIKLALTGHGRASKRQVQQMVRAVLGLAEIPKPDHAADALAAALCYLHSQGPARRAAEALARPAEGAANAPENLNKALLAQARGRRRRR